MIFIEILGAVIGTLCIVVAIVFIVALCRELRNEDKTYNEMKHCKRCIHLTMNADGTPCCGKGVSILCIGQGFKYREEKHWRHESNLH